MPIDNLINHFDVLIVGSGHAGAQAAIALRQLHFSGRVGIAGDEPGLPYERPPLSKDFLSGEKAPEQFQIRPSSFWPAHQIEILPGSRVVQVNPVAHTVSVEGRGESKYGSLIWAAGGAPRHLSCPGSDLPGIHYIRNLADVVHLRAELATAQDIVIIGGGYIGLEAAAVLSKLGKAVTVVEALNRILARVACEEISDFYQQEHRQNGVSLRLGVAATCIEEREGRASGVRLSAGAPLSADLIIVGIGIVPAVEPLIQAGAAGKNGVDVDSFCRTSLPDVFAVGDCAAHINSFAEDRRIRLESVQNANDQAKVAASTIVGNGAPYTSVPWFWSNQYDLRLQTVGLSGGYDHVVVRGSPASRSFSAIYLRQGTVIALDCVNASRDYVQGRSLVVARAKPDLSALADCSVGLKSLVSGTEAA
jgi:3-phenylpropionate/trans-cinnamate dioxygenase ferredoxin reductase component